MHAQESARADRVHRPAASPTWPGLEERAVQPKAPSAFDTLRYWWKHLFQR